MRVQFALLSASASLSAICTPLQSAANTDFVGLVILFLEHFSLSTFSEPEKGFIIQKD